MKGFSNGFINPIAEIPYENESIHVGLSSIGASPDKGKSRMGHTKGLLAKSVGESYMRVLKGEAKDGKQRIMAEEEKDKFVMVGMKMSSNDPVKLLGGEEILSKGYDKSPVSIFSMTETTDG